MTSKIISTALLNEMADHCRDDESDEKEDLPSKKIALDHGSTSGIGSVVAQHYNEIEEKGRSERYKSRIFYMRNFNNWVKSYLLSYFIKRLRKILPNGQRIVGMDLGCGKGGDLLKWQKGNVNHVVCVDIASTSVTQCKERYQVMKNSGRAPTFSSEFIVADCTKELVKDQMRNPDMKYDLVSTQFVLHYSFESLHQAETFIKNASENLRKGGYLIGTIPDANEIMSHLERSEGNTFGNDVFRIEFPEDRPEDPPLFGDRYNFFLEGVVNCPEFLVHFATLERICLKYGLSPVLKQRFDGILKDGLLDEESKYLVKKISALEPYSLDKKGSTVASDPEEYAHAEEHLKQTGVRLIHTLSKSEWDAITLYTAFAFKKL
ncbi:RNA guanine-7 methyltransferase isoform X2 [Oratosquilla oratoria]|uniref:RNA guanine-7 methyltransferase isoform X2 n=1 Tax=Oratosquilla oratoria TaxID=337810 RepID=UPI003F771902